jgi:hypothetical protein
MFDSQKNFNRLNNKSIKYRPGLKYTAYEGSMRDRYDTFFTTNPKVITTGVSIDFSNLGAETGNKIRENVGSGGGAVRQNDWGEHNFTIEWTGFFKPSQTGVYQFFLESDDSSILWVGDSANDPKTATALVNDLGEHGMLKKDMTTTKPSYTINENDLNYHPIRIRFEEGYGGFGCIFKILDKDGNDVSKTSLFHVDPNMFTYYSLIRSIDSPNLYDCYITGSNYNIDKSQGKKYLYRQLIVFPPYTNKEGNVVPSGPTFYMAVGDDGTMQIYNAKKNIDFEGKESRNFVHDEFVCTINPDNTWQNTGGATYENGLKFRKDISYRFQSDGNFIGTTKNEGGAFLSWQNWLGLGGNNPIGNQIYDTLNNKTNSYTDDKTGVIYGPLERGAFTINADENTYTTQRPLTTRKIIVHKNNPFNKTGMNHVIVSEGGNYKIRMTDQGKFTFIYAVPACMSVENNGVNVNYTQADQSSFSFYKVIADPKINQTFLYDPDKNTLDYVDVNKFADAKTNINNIYTYNSPPDYTEYKDIYIPAKFKLPSNKSGNYGTISINDCKKVCDDTKSCGYYYFSKIDGQNQCYTDTSSSATKHLFTPSSDVSGSTPEFINKNPSSLFVKEKTVIVGSSLSTNTDINKIVVDYTDPKYMNAITSYDSYNFENRLKNSSQGGLGSVLVDSDLKTVKTNELEYYGYSPTLINESAIPSGITVQQPFISGGSRIEGFQEGAVGETSTSVNTNGAVSAGLQITGQTNGAYVADNSQPIINNNYGSSPISTNKQIQTMGTGMPGSTTGAGDSVNLNAFTSFVPPEPITIPKYSTPDFGFFEGVYCHTRNVTIHLPLYVLELWKDTTGKNVIGCKNRGFYQKNFDEAGCKDKDTYKIIKTQADSPNPLYNAIYAGTSDDMVNNNKTDERLPFSNNYILLDQKPNQFLRINETINYPPNCLCFSFYFKVPADCTTYSRIFDFSNGQGQDNVIAFFHNTGSGISLGFVCFGENVYGQTVGANGSNYCGYQNKADQLENYTFFHNLENKWHYCEWYMQRFNYPNPSKTNADGNPIPTINQTGIQIAWWLVLHTLQDDNTIKKQYYLLIDSTFSNYRDKYDQTNYPERRQWLGPDSDSSNPWRKSPNNYISRSVAYNNGNDHIPLSGQIRSIDQTRDCVDGWDCIIIGGISQNENSWLWNTSTLRPYYYSTSPFRLSFPTKPTQINFIGGSPWVAQGCTWDLLKGSVRDFKMISQEYKFHVAGYIGSFNWCTDAAEMAWWANRGPTFGNKQGSAEYFKGDTWQKGGAYEDWNMFLWQPIANDNNTGFFSSLAYKTEGNKLGFMSPGGDVSFTYNSEVTNNFANFIYSQIIYNDKMRAILKPYLQTMATYTPNGIKQPFSNIEGFAESSIPHSLIEGYSVEESTYPILTEKANDMNSKTVNYNTSLGNISENTKDLQRYINKKLVFQRDVKDISRDGKTDFYDFSGNLLYYNDKEIPSLRDTKISDNQEFIIQQNTVYIIGTITCATMIIAAIILGRQ